jgi:hemolysin-activating ACP:hemolysin acyltransferase
LSSIRQSLSFAQIVTVLMRSPHYRHYTLGDLEWLVIPPLVTGQCIVANTSLKQNGVTVPVAVALWASVSPDVDKKLSENLHLPIRLRPDEWRSGDVLWLIDAVGDSRAVPQLLKQLVETRFKGREVKFRIPGENGKVTVQRIAETASANAVTQKH